MQAAPSALTRESMGHLNYLHSVLTQPLGSWQEFYTPQSPTMNFAVRYQLAFASYALATMSQRTPAYRAPYVEAIRAAIEKMLHVTSWGYWRAPQTDQQAAAGSHANVGHVAVLLSPHQRGPAGPPSDPIVRDNLQYSGHLSTMLGLYEKVSGDNLYDRPFTLQDPESGVSYTYTHSQVAERIYSQMRANRFGGVCCEPGMAYVPCNNYALASNTLHDALHGTTYSHANQEWLRTVRRKMVLKGKALRGIFAASYIKDVGLATPVAFNFTDVWGLAFLLPFDRALVRKLYGSFRKRVSREGRDLAFVSSSSFSEKMEISDVAINTGFGMSLAQGMGDMRVAGAFRQYSVDALGASWRGNHYLCKAAPRTLQSTALFALADAIEPGGEGFARLFRDAPDTSAHNQPLLERVLDASGRVGVCQAEYSPQERVLRIGLCQVGELAQAGNAPVDTTLFISNISAQPRVEVTGLAGAEEAYAVSSDGLLQVSVPVTSEGIASCVVRLG
jgi:hypothetical protein